jgi:hypothetical protein
MNNTHKENKRLKRLEKRKNRALQELNRGGKLNRQQQRDILADKAGY